MKTNQGMTPTWLLKEWALTELTPDSLKPKQNWGTLQPLILFSLFISSLFCHANGFIPAQVEHIWGEYGIQEQCPVEHYAIGFRTKADDSGDLDKRGLSGLQLKCSDSAGTVLTSLEGPWGTWDSSFQECQEGFKAVRGEFQNAQVGV